jgi:hypothetical protein
MLFSLVKKDFILTKRYWIYSIIFSIIVPVFIQYKLNYSFNSGFLTFFIAVYYLEHQLLSTVWMVENKYKGGIHLCITPYTRNMLVIARYLFMLSIFGFSIITYTVLSRILNVLTILDTSVIGISFLFITLIFGIIISLNYKYGYQKTRYITLILFIAINFIFPTIIKRIYASGINFGSFLSYALQSYIPFLLAIIIGVIAIMISINIYSKKDL